MPGVTVKKKKKKKKKKEQQADQKNINGLHHQPHFLISEASFFWINVERCTYKKKLDDQGFAHFNDLIKAPPFMISKS